MNKRRIVGIVVMLVIGMIIFTILTSKNNISTEERLSQIESERKPDNYIPANIKMKVKDFTVYTENKEKVNIEKYIGSKPMVIVFWASWCIDCRENLIKIEAAKEKYYKEDVEFIVVNITDGEHETKETADTYLKFNNISLDTYYDYDLNAYKAYNLNTLPRMMFVDRNGIIVQDRKASIDEKGLDLSIKNLISPEE